jgi:acetoin utilization deacetylase AcuC-like enzyme
MASIIEETDPECVSEVAIMKTTGVYLGKQLAAYNFGASHPFGPARHDAFVEEFKRRQLDKHVTLLEPVSTDQQSIELFQDSAYVEQVRRMSISSEAACLLPAVCLMVSGGYLMVMCKTPLFL